MVSSHFVIMNRKLHWSKVMFHKITYFLFFRLFVCLIFFFFFLMIIWFWNLTKSLREVDLMT